MDDQVLIEQAHGLAPVYVDGFGAWRKVNGVMRCVGFLLQGGAQLNLIISLAGAEIGNREARRVLNEGPTPCMNIWSGTELAH